MNKIVFIGHFSGDSFGNAGDPFQTYPYYALASDMEAFASTREGSQLIAFNNKFDAEKRLESLARSAADETATAWEQRSSRQTRLIRGRSIRAAIQNFTGEAVRQLRWSERNSPEAKGGCEAVADGRKFHVWINSTGQLMRITELSVT